jgi:hypothetical protein
MFTVSPFLLVNHMPADWTEFQRHFAFTVTVALLGGGGVFSSTITANSGSSGIASGAIVSAAGIRGFALVERVGFSFTIASLVLVSI